MKQGKQHKIKWEQEDTFTQHNPKRDPDFDKDLYMERVERKQPEGLVKLPLSILDKIKI